MPMTTRSRLGLILPFVMAGVVGCSGSESGPSGLPANPETATLVPVTGVITLNHKPLGKAVVVFMPKQSATSVGETDPEGRYTLESYGGRPGVPAGDYKVAISYRVSPKGKPLGLAARSSLSQTPDMVSAKERLPNAYSDLGRTKLRASVGDKGGPFDFDIDAPDVDMAPETTDQKETAAK